jgi:hypothetical protein
MDGMGLKIASIEKTSAETASKLSGLEVEIAALKLQSASASTSPNQGTPTALVGGIPQSGTFEEAKTWINQRLKNTGIAQPVEMYFKTTFTGIVFAKFSTQVHRDQFINPIPGAPMEGTTKPWAKFDLPMGQQQRASFPR